MLRATPALMALIVAMFVSFYPQVGAAGYCVGDVCPEIASSTHASGGASGGAHTGGTHGTGVTGLCLVAAALVSGSALAAASAAGLARLAAYSGAPPRSLCLSPDTPPPQNLL
jgi:hypothetical protein